jgi:hypothetical protein
MQPSDHQATIRPSGNHASNVWGCWPVLLCDGVMIYVGVRWYAMVSDNARCYAIIRWYAMIRDGVRWWAMVCFSGWVLLLMLLRGVVVGEWVGEWQVL